MSKFAKGSLITAGIFLAIGFVLCLISCIIGGKRILTDGKTIFGNMEWVENSCEWVGDRLTDMNIPINRTTWSTEWHYEYPQELLLNGEEIAGKKATATVDAISVEKLKLLLGAGDFRIEEKDQADNKIDIEIRGFGECDYYVSNGTFYMEAFQNGINGNFDTNTIRVFLPKGMVYSVVDAEIGAGKMDIKSLNAKELSVHLGAGDMSLKNMEIDELTAEIGAGHMDAEDVQVKDADLTVNLGMCEFDGSISGDMYAECAMGTLSMDLEGKSEDHNYNIECATGTITVDGFGSAAIATDKVVNNNASSTYTINCSLGTISIDFDD